MNAVSHKIYTIYALQRLRLLSISNESATAIVNDLTRASNKTQIVAQLENNNNNKKI